VQKSKLLICVSFIFLFCNITFAQEGSEGIKTWLEEEDGSPSVIVYKTKVTNGTLTDGGDGTASLSIGGGGAPTDADYLVGTTNGSLSGEIVVGTTPGGSLGGTWASPTIDDLFLKNDGDNGTGNYDFTGATTFLVPDATQETQALNFRTALNLIGVSYTFWIQGSNTLGLTYALNPQERTELVNANPDTLTNIYYKSAVADTITPLTIKEGTEILTHYQAKVDTTVTGKTVTLSTHLFYVDSDGTSNPVQIGTDSPVTADLTTSKLLYEGYIIVTTETIVPAGKRLWLKFIATPSTLTGYSPTVSVWDGDIHDHLSIPVSGSILGRFVQKSGDTMTGTLTADGLTIGNDELITFGTHTLKYDGTTDNDFELSDDLTIEDATPHLRLTDTTAAEDDFEIYADGNRFVLTNATDGLDILYVNTDNTIALLRDTTVPTEVYDATNWDADYTIPTKDAIRDKIESLAGGHNAVTLAADADTLLGLSTQQLTLDTQTANYVFAGPTTGAATDPAFRALVDADIISGITRDVEWDTEAEVQTAWGAVNILLETEIDASSELLALMDDETGTGVLVFNDSPTFADDIQLGQNGADGKLIFWAEQATDRLASLNPHSAMTSNADFYLPADEPAATSFINMTTGGVMGFIAPNAGTDITADLEEEVTEGSLADNVIVSADIKNGEVAYADIQNISATSRVLGRISTGVGVTEELTGANIKTIIGDVALTTDTSGNYVKDVADGTGIDGTASAEGATYTPTLDLTEISGVTISAGGSASFAWTFDLSGTDDVVTFNSALVNITGGLTTSLDLTATGNDLILGTAAAGVTLTGDGDGQLTIGGFGDGTDENLIINLDDTANEADITSGTGILDIDFNTIDLNTDTLDLTGTGTINGLDSVDATGEDTIEALIFDSDAENISGTWEVQDDVDFVFGNDANWKIQYDEGVDDQLIFITAGTGAIATTDPMFEILVGAAPTANQEVFGVSKGTQASNTALFTIDEDGDTLNTGDFTVTGGDIVLGTTSIFSGGDTASLNNIDAIDATTETTLEAAIDTIVGTLTTDGLTMGNNENLTFGTETFTFDGATSNDFELSDDLNINDTTPHIGLIDSDGDDYEIYADGNRLVATNKTDLIDVFGIHTDNTFWARTPTFSGTTTLGILAGTIDAGSATSFEIPNAASLTLDAAGEIGVNSTHKGLAWYDGTQEVFSPSIHTLQGSIGTGDYDTDPDVWILDLDADTYPHGIYITKVYVDANEADPTTELTANLNYCDATTAAFPGANATLIKAINTTTGNFSNTAVNTAVASGKSIYITIGADPTSDTTIFHVRAQFYIPES